MLRGFFVFVFLTFNPFAVVLLLVGLPPWSAIRHIQGPVEYPPPPDQGHSILDPDRRGVSGKVRSINPNLPHSH